MSKENAHLYFIVIKHLSFKIDNSIWVCKAPKTHGKQVWASCIYLKPCLKYNKSIHCVLFQISMDLNPCSIVKYPPMIF